MLSGSKLPQDKIDISKLLPYWGVVSAETQARKAFGAELLGNRLEPVIAAAATMLAVANFAKIKIKIITNY